MIMAKEKKSGSRKKGYIISISLILIFISVMLNYEGVTSCETPKDLIGALSNCFSVPGVLFAGIGGLSLLSKLGAYDSFGYIFGKFALHNIFVTKQQKHYDSLYDYKAEKDAKGRAWLPQVLFVGLVSLGVGIVLLVIYFIL